MDLIEWLENILLKMVKGIPEFIFVIAPKNLWQMFCDTFPSLVRLVRVSFLFCAWFLMTAWPLPTNTMFSSYMPTFLSGVVKIKFISDHQSLINIFSLIWIGLALSGSIWGMTHVVIRKRRARRLAKSGSPAHTPE